MDFHREPYDPRATEDWLVCAACGTQHPTSDRASRPTCFICDDPRQYTPPSGQSFTTLAALRGASHRNVFRPYGADPRLTFISSEPAVGIGQRAILVRTPQGNILWDCITLLDDETVAKIRELGGISAIVISHPHFYSAHVEWARAFACPVYLSAVDKRWAAQTSAHQVWLTEVETEVVLAGGERSGARAIRLGGHFPGSMCLLFDRRLLCADTLYVTPAGTAEWSVDALGNKRERPAGTNSFAFLWSVPNAIPLSAEEIARMWAILKRYDFRSAHGGFFAKDVEDERVKHRVLESMQIQVKAMGWGESPLMKETL